MKCLNYDNKLSQLKGLWGEPLICRSSMDCLEVHYF